MGPDEILDLAEKIVAAAGRFRIAWSDRRVRVNGDTAWINATGAATWETEGTVRRLPYRLTGVLVRRDGVWLWHTHHGSEPEASS